MKNRISMKYAMLAPAAWVYEWALYCKSSGTMPWKWKAARNLHLPERTERWFTR